MDRNNNHKTKRKVYRGYIRENGKLKASPQFTRKADLELWYEQKRASKAKLKAGLSDSIREITVSDFADRWLTARKAAGKPMSSWVMDEARLRIYIKPQFGSRRVHTVTTWEWEEFLDSLVDANTMAAGSRNRIRSLLSKFYNDAWRKQHVLSNPITIIPKLREYDDKWDCWESREEIVRYLSFAKRVGRSFHLFAACSLNLGLRVCETLALTLGDLSLERRGVRINKIFEQQTWTIQKRTKAHKIRHLGINDELLSVFNDYGVFGSDQKPNQSLVCFEDGSPMDPFTIRKIHKQVCEASDLKKIRVHDLRHTFASHYIMNGGSMKFLQEILGHSGEQMTMKYAHLKPGFLTTKANVVGFAAEPIKPKLVVVS